MNQELANLFRKAQVMTSSFQARGNISANILRACPILGPRA